MAPYLPGRTVRTASSVRFQSTVIWAGLSFVVAAVLVANGVRVGMWGVVVAVAIPLAYTALLKSRLRAYNVANAPAHAALKQGDAATAERGFAANRERFRYPRVLPRLTDFNIAQSRFRQGKLRDSMALLADVDRRGGVLNVDGAIAATLAYGHALCGEVELAETWLAEGHRRYARYPNVPAYADIHSEVVLDLRRGRAAEVAKRLADDWRQIESTLTGERIRPLRVLRAFAVAQSSDPREAGAIAPILASLESANDVAYLGAEWPELARFIATSLPSRLAPTG